MTAQRSKQRMGFIWTPEIVGPDNRVTFRGPPVKNLIPQVGVDHLAGLLRGTAEPIASWYVGVFENNFAPGMDTKASDLQTEMGECVSYSHATRPAWAHTYDGVDFISNLASRAEYPMTVSKRLYGGFIVSSATKGGDTGVLLSVARFNSPYDVPAGSTFRLGVSLSLLSAE